MEVRVKIKKSAYAPHYAEAKYNGCKGVIIQSSKIHNSYVIKIDKKYTQQAKIIACCKYCL